MTVKIRLSKIGKKFAPAFKIVAADSRTKRSGKSLEIVGHYNPSTTPVDLKIDKALYESLLKTGAQPTSAVKKLIDGKYEFKPYRPKGKKNTTESTDNTAGEEVPTQVVETEATEAGTEEQSEA